MYNNVHCTGDQITIIIIIHYHINKYAEPQAILLTTERQQQQYGHQ